MAWFSPYVARLFGPRRFADGLAKRQGVVTGSRQAWMPGNPGAVA